MWHKQVQSKETDVAQQQRELQEYQRDVVLLLEGESNCSAAQSRV